MSLRQLAGIFRETKAMRYFLLGLTIVLMVCGQLLFKTVANESNGSPLAFLLRPIFILALVIYGAATVSWILTLRVWPLNVAYPATALAIVLVVAVGALWFGESLSSIQAAGITVIVGGLVLMAFG